VACCAHVTWQCFFKPDFFLFLICRFSLTTNCNRWPHSLLSIMATMTMNSQMAKIHYSMYTLLVIVFLVCMHVCACLRLGGGCRGYNTDKIKFVIANCSDREDVFLFCKWSDFTNFAFRCKCFIWTDLINFTFFSSREII
jgi:hypothetical protein